MIIVEACQQNFSFRFPSDILHKRTKNFLDKVSQVTPTLYLVIIVTIVFFVSTAMVLNKYV